MEGFAFEAQIPVLPVFMNMNKNDQRCRQAEKAVDIGSRIIPSTELSTGCQGLATLSQQQEITRSEKGVTEGSKAYDVALFAEEKCPVKIQPKLQRTSEQSA